MIQTAFLGDVILTIPLFQGIKERFPNASLTVLVVPRTAQILEEVAVLDHVITYNKKGAQKGFFGWMALIRQIQMVRFDLCLLPHRSVRSGFIALLSRIPRRVGFQTVFGRFIYTDQIKWDPLRHEVERNLELLRPFGPVKKGGFAGHPLSVDSLSSEKVDNTFRLNGIAAGDCIIGMAPGSVWATKRWLPEGFASVVDSLSDRFKTKVLLLGSKEEKLLARDILNQCRHTAIDLCGQDLKELVATLSRCQVLVTNDNGAMHVATALGIPVVAIFGSTSPLAGYGPYSATAEIVEHPLECRPCGPHGHQQCPLGHFRCMKEITPEEVVAAVERLLASPNRGL